MHMCIAGMGRGADSVQVFCVHSTCVCVIAICGDQAREVYISPLWST